MKKIIECFWNNRISKKGSFIVLFVTVILSSMAVFGVMNALPLLKISLRNDMKVPQYGNSTFVITDKNNQMFSLEDIQTKEKLLGMLSWYGSITNEGQKKCNLLGGDYLELPELFDVELVSEEILDDNSEGIMITQWMAEEMEVSKGESLEVLINETMYTFQISGILKNQGIFEENTYIVLMPRGRLSEILGIEKDYVSIAYIYGCDTTTEIEEIEINENLKIIKTIDEDYINSELSMYSILMIFILVFVFFVAFYIIYNLYNIFVIERSNYIGTLLSCGAKRSYVRRIFLTANIAISVIGGVIAVLVVGVAVSILSSQVFGVDYLRNEFTYMIFCAGVTIIFSVGLGMLSLVIPINRVLRCSDRALICNEIEHSRKNRKLISVVAFFVTIALWGITSMYESKNLFVEVGIFVLFIIASVLAINSFIEAVDKAVGSRVGNGKLLFALKNVIHNVYVQKNITIVVILLVLMMLIGNLSYSVVKGLTSFYNNYKCNVYFQPYVSLTDEELAILDEIDEISEYYACISKRVVINGMDEVSSFIEKEPEILSNNFLEFNIQWKDFSPEKFSQDRYCIITDVLSKRYELSTGDIVSVKRGDVEADYTIAAISYSTIEKGNFVFLSPYELPFDNCTTYNMVLAECDNIDVLKESLDVKFSDREFEITSVADKVKADEESFTGVITLYACFAVFVVLIGIQGIYDNFKLCYMNRKKVFAVMLSNGYRLKDIISILSIEVIICNLFGGMISILYMLFYRQEIIHIMFLMDLALPLRQNIWIMLLPIVLCLLASFVCIVYAYGELNKIKNNLIEILKIY